MSTLEHAMPSLSASAVPGANPELWSRVDALVARAPRLSDLRAHRLNLVAGQRWRADGRTVPAELDAEMRAAGIAELLTPWLLERVRSVVDGPILVMKGPEVSAHYPQPALRPFGDIDILVPNAQAAQRALIAAGFRPVGLDYLYVDIHHLRPLALRGVPMVVEVHSEPKWVDGLAGPPLDEMFAAAVPSATAVDGVSTLRPAHHALVLAAHSWGHHPLRRLGDLIDVAVMSAGSDDAELDRLARRWGISRVWRTTHAALRASLFDEPKPWALRIWARNLPAVRERTVLESHLDRLFADFWSLPSHRAAWAMATAVVRAVRPAPWESWGTKLARTRRAFANASLRKSEHESALEHVSWSEVVGRALASGDAKTIKKLGVKELEASESE